MKKQGVQLADALDQFLAVEPLSPKDTELDEEDLKSALAELERVWVLIQHTVVSASGIFQISEFWIEESTLSSKPSGQPLPCHKAFY